MRCQEISWLRTQEHNFDVTCKPADNVAPARLHTQQTHEKIFDTTGLPLDTVCMHSNQRSSMLPYLEWVHYSLEYNHLKLLNKGLIELWKFISHSIATHRS